MGSLAEAGSPRRRTAVRRDGLFCRYCGDPVVRFVLDHVLPRSRGGSDGLRNRVVACLPCDQRKGNRTLAELGWSLHPPRGDQPTIHKVRTNRPPKVTPVACVERQRSDEVSRRRAVAAVESERKSFAMDRSLFPPYVIPVGRSDKGRLSR